MNILRTTLKTIRLKYAKLGEILNIKPENDPIGEQPHFYSKNFRRNYMDKNNETKFAIGLAAAVSMYGGFYESLNWY